MNPPMHASPATRRLSLLFTLVVQLLCCVGPSPTLQLEINTKPACNLSSRDGLKILVRWKYMAYSFARYVLCRVLSVPG